MGAPVRFIAAIIEADVHGYSKMSEKEKQAFEEHLVPDIRDLLTRWSPRYSSVDKGDRIQAYFDDILNAARCAVELRNAFQNPHLEVDGLPALSIRIALHAGWFELRGKKPVGGEHTLAARLEPVVKPGQIWASEAFRILFEQRETEYLRLVALGERQFAEDFGIQPVYLLLSADEESAWSASSASTPAHNSALALLLELAQTGTDAQKLTAIDALGTFNSGAAVQALGRALLSDTNVMNRSMAALSLGQLASPDGFHFLSKALVKEKIPAVRSAVVQALGEIGDTRAIQPLIQLFDKMVEDALHSTAGKSPARAERDNPICDADAFLCRVLLALSRMRTTDVVGRVIIALRSQNTFLVEAACLAAEALGEEPTVTKELLQIARPDSRWTSHVRGSAMEALLRTGLRHGDVALVAALAKDQNEAAEVRLPGLDLLALSRTREAREALIEVAKDKDDPLSPNAVQAVALAYQATSLDRPTLLGGELRRQLDIVREAFTLTKIGSKRTA